jgi:hypothetical protein
MESIISGHRDTGHIEASARGTLVASNAIDRGVKGGTLNSPTRHRSNATSRRHGLHAILNTTQKYGHNQLRLSHKRAIAS